MRTIEMMEDELREQDEKLNLSQNNMTALITGKAAEVSLLCQSADSNTNEWSISRPMAPLPSSCKTVDDGPDVQEFD
jgi:hypothetical protein